MLRIAIRLLVPMILVAVIASTCGDGYSPAPIPDGGPPLFAVLDELEERGGILHIQIREFTHRGLLVSYEQAGEEFRLPEYLISDIWLLSREDGTGEVAWLTRGEDGEFISRFGLVDGEYINEHVPSGTVTQRGENAESLAESPNLLTAYGDALERTAEGYRIRLANGGMTLEPSGNAGTVVLVLPRTVACGRGMTVEMPVGVIEERTEVTEAGYVTVRSTCIVTTPDGQEILINEDIPRWERLDADRWDDIVSFVFGG